MSGSTRPIVVFRADGGPVIGSGHIMRCLTLAEVLVGAGCEVLFVCRDFPGNLSGLATSRGHDVMLLPHLDDWSEGSDAAETMTAMAAAGVPFADWVMADHYGIGAAWEEHMRAVARQVLAIDDLADRRHACDLLVDQNLVEGLEHRYSGLLPEAARQLLGPRFALLQPEFSVARRQLPERVHPPRRVLVYFGGSDSEDMTGRTLAALLAAGRDALEIDVVAGVSYAHWASLEQAAAGRPAVRLHRSQPSLAPLLRTADLAIGASGTTSWERLCLKVPALVVTLADNQRGIAAELDRWGLVRWMGDAAALTAERWSEAVRAVARDGIAADFGKAPEVDGLGARRVAVAMLAGPELALTVRNAERGDEQLLLEWANDPETRANAFNPNPIAPQVHGRWFRARLGQPESCRLMIIDALGIAVGQVRFEREDGGWVISYAVAPEFRGRGLGRPMLAAAIAALRAVGAVGELVARVKPANLASRRIFAHLNFALVASDESAVEFRLRADS